MLWADTSLRFEGRGSYQEPCGSLVSAFALPSVLSLLTVGHDIDRIPEFCVLSFSSL